jgi:hypothetical protein
VNTELCLGSRSVYGGHLLFSALIIAAWGAWMSSFLLCVCCMVCRRWRLAFMEDDAVGLMKAASNDNGLGE